MEFFINKWKLDRADIGVGLITVNENKIRSRWRHRFEFEAERLGYKVEYRPTSNTTLNN